MIKINQTKIFETYKEFIKYENQFKNVPHKVYIFLIRMTSRVDLAMAVCPSV